MVICLGKCQSELFLHIQYVSVRITLQRLGSDITLENVLTMVNGYTRQFRKN